jgi:polar amino acid transport system substrate-binding protein
MANLTSCPNALPFKGSGQGSEMRRAKSLITTIFFFSIALVAWPQEYRVAVKELPTTRFYMDMLNALAEEMDIKLDIKIYPSARADYLIATNRVDMVVPVLDAEDFARPSRRCDYGSAILYESAFILFSAKGKSIDINSLKNGNSRRYSIEADIAIADQLGFSASPSTTIEGSLGKVNEGKIDGYIFSQTSTDPIARKLSLPNVKRQLYANYHLHYALKKGERDGSLDKLIAEGISKMKNNGKYERIMGKLIAAARYSDWQP